MKTAAIVCEYDPLHLGHVRQYRLARQALGADARIVCLMSGNFVQRGRPAIIDAPTRARAAVECGADLVLRDDDKPETVKNRLEVYHSETEPLKDFYKARGILKSVDNQPTIEATTKVVEAALGI